MDAATWFALQHFYAEYGRVLDAGDYARWPDFFVEGAVYKVQSRENFDRGLPLATIALESRAMLKDRVVGATDTIYHDPYAQRHVIGAPVVVTVDGDEICSEASYLVVRTKRDAMPEILSVGRYVDRIRRDADGLRLVERLCVFDNDLIPNSLIYPI
ncbi:MAG: nuclear transport factor 2 family protein [Lautropia sp.]